ncbi:MAG: TetR/AcrR family transcriptional regulator [bacterium]|nr:TetR/AcrR family transcriptional regulator [bacterium]
MSDRTQNESAPEQGYAKSRETRARILAAALEEAGESGLQKTSMSRVAMRAGVAQGSLNYHFGSRAELIRELMLQLVSDYLPHAQSVESAQAAEGGDFFARERAVLLAYVAYVRKHPVFVRLSDEIRMLEPEMARERELESVERFVTRVRSGIDEGSVRPMDERDLWLKSRFMLGVRHTLEEIALTESDLHDAEIVDAYLDMLRSGLAPRDFHAIH